MRMFILLLVLVNVALLAYFNMDKVLPKKALTYKELNPGKLKLLMDEDFGSLEKKKLSARPLNYCYKWGSFTDANLAAAQEVMARLGLEADVVQESGVKQERRFWIYYPPLATTEKAQAKVEEIKKLGVDELYIVQDSKWRNAISFGLFSEEPLANNLLKNLRAKGVNHAVKSLRNQGNATSSLVAKSVSAESAVELYKIRPEFVGSEVTPVACR
tara:strand:- start:779 stop:1423 length:645 start_codon:yes stop_codon:yes gene_type:complete